MSPEALMILQIASRVRLTLTDEKRAQEEFSEVLTAQGIAHEREVTLAPGDIVDFMVGGIAVEMKVKGQRMAIYRQLVRYATHDQVQEIVLLSARCMGLPEAIHGKPAAVASLSRAFL